jgi:hypothetical protein
MSAETLNEETLAMAMGALLSLAFSYIPAWENGTPQGPIRFFVFNSIMVSFSDAFPHILSFMKNISGANSSSGFVGAKYPPEAMHGFPMIVGGCFALTLGL